MSPAQNVRTHVVLQKHLDATFLLQERLAALVEERKQVIEDEEHGGKRRSKGEKGGPGIQVDAEDMVQKEAQRLEVMKRRQERELGQMVAYELMRKEMQVRCTQIATFDVFMCCNLPIAGTLPRQ